MKDLVSINLPLYGSFNRDSLKLVFDAIKQQTYSSIEIVLSEQNSKPTFKDEATRNSLNYCFSEILVVGESVTFLRV